MTVGTVLTEEDIDRRYRAMSAYRAGRLPAERGAVDGWLQALTRAVAGGPAELRPSVQKVKDLIDGDSIVRMYANEMIAQVPPDHRNGIGSVDDLMRRLNVIVTTAPAYDSNKLRRITFPMSALFVYMMMTTGGEALFRHYAFNEAIRGVLQDWCQYLDSEESSHVLAGWLSPPAGNELKLEDFVTDKGFSSYNDFFHRAIKPEKRPVTPGDGVIVSANDGEVYRLARDVKESDTFWLKDQQYSLKDMFGGVGYEDFVGGTVLQSFLSGADYHRWHAPYGGRVVDSRVIGGLLFSELEAAGDDPTAGTYSQGYGASVNTRGLVVIEHGDLEGGTFRAGPLGKVAVLPVGITEISSITITVDKGQVLEKGNQLGWFSYGGSSLCLVFQNRDITFVDAYGWDIDAGSLLRVNDQVGTYQAR
jgi:phosphatidylserine decarboxylase